MIQHIGAGLLTAFVCASVSLGTARAENFLLNPSFEMGAAALTTPCGGGGTGCTWSVGGEQGGPYPFDVFSPDTTTIPDWAISTNTYQGGVIELTSGGTSAYSSLYPPPDGSAFAYTTGGSIYQTVSETMVAGDTYTLTAWVANLSQGYNQFVESVYVESGGFGGPAVFGSSTVVTTVGQWTELTGSFLAPSADSGDSMTVVLFNQGGSGTSFFDNVCLTNTTCAAVSPIPEPTSILLLLTVVAGLAFISRRRITA